MSQVVLYFDQKIRDDPGFIAGFIIYQKHV